MKRPECDCFRSVAGESKVCYVAIEVNDVFSVAMNEAGVCQVAWDYALTTSIVMLMKNVAAQTSEGNAEREQATFHRMLSGLVERVRERGDEMHQEAMILDAGGRQ